MYCVCRVLQVWESQGVLAEAATTIKKAMSLVLRCVLFLQVPEGLELAVHSMRAEEHALVTISDPALAAAPEGEECRMHRTCALPAAALSD